MRLQDETERCRVVTLWPLKEGQEGQLRPYMPWRLAGQEAVPVGGRHVVDSFEVELYARRQRRLRLFERRAVRSDIEVGTDCMPLVAADTSVTSQREVHFGIPLDVATTVEQRTIATRPRVVLRTRSVTRSVK